MLSYNRVKTSARFILNQIETPLDIAIILGSGLGAYHERLENPVRISYEDIPDFPPATALGHKSMLAFGKLGGKSVAMMCGRYHCYEGYTMEQSAFPVYVLKELGVKVIIVTNATGCINTSFNAGELMLITDHIKLVSDSPLRGKNYDELGPRFNDMTYAYTPRLQRLARDAAKRLGITLREGVYAYMPGPSYETPAEIRALRTLGADAVGMSTVAEVIAASHCGLEVLGVSLLTNMAAGILDKPLTHSEVLEAGNKGSQTLSALIDHIISEIEG